jgi:hypothetical protein
LLTIIRFGIRYCPSNPARVLGFLEMGSEE